MIILDASVLIGHFEPADAHHAEATALLKSHASETFAASVVTLAEVYVGAARASQADRLSHLLAQLQIESLDLPPGAASSRPPMGPELFTQPVTGPDLAAGRIRIPAATKPALPDSKGPINVVLHGIAMEVRWDPRNGPDRARSGGAQHRPSTSSFRGDAGRAVDGNRSGGRKCRTRLTTDYSSE